MKRLYWFFIILVLTVSSTTAQLTSGTLVGVVVGPDGALIPGANITVKGEQSGTEVSATTDANGNFRIPDLQVGNYTVSVTSAGFKTFTANNVKIDISKDYSLPVTLEVGAIQETVVVTAGEEIINSVDAEINNTVSRKQLDDLPSLGRNPLNFVPLQPGAASNPSQNTVINGIRTSGTNTTIDGINVQDNFIRSNATDFSPARPTVDEVEEFAVSSQTNAGDGFGGAQIQFTTRRGTNRYNARLFEFNRNSALAANDFFNNANGTPRPFRNRNQFGGNLGGPLPFFNFGEGGPVFTSGKDKLFFFFSYEKLIDRVPAAPQFSTVLTANARQGIFTYVDNSGQTQTVNLFNSAFGTGITGINPIIGSRFLANIPSGNTRQVGDQRNTTGYTVIQNFNQTQSNYATRIDYAVNSSNNISGTYRYVKQETNRADAGIDDSFNTEPRVVQPSVNPFVSIGWNAAFSSNFSNELRGGFFGSDPIFLRRDPNLSNYFNLPLVTNPEVAYQNQGRYVDTYNLQDNATYIYGSHNLRFGGQFQRVEILSFDAAGTVPTYTIASGTGTPAITTAQFNNAALFPGGISTAQRTVANQLLALLGGVVTGGTQSFNVTSQTSGFVPGANQTRDFNYNIFGFHLSDQWQITKNLTINLGLRYDLYTALKSASGLFLEPAITDINNPVASLLNPSGRYQFIGGNAGAPGRFYKTDKNNFAPVFSFAYSPNFGGGIGKTLFGEKGTVIRGGYRISYINDELVRAPDNALSGNQGLTLAGNLANLNARIDNLPPIATPAFLGANRTFAQNNAAATGFGTVFSIDPLIKSPMVQEYTFGVQREVGFDTALEVRYVGTRSSNLLRGIDYNQIDIFSNGFLADFNRARANLRLTGNPACTTAGCQPLTIFPQFASGGLLTNGTIQNLIETGQPAQLIFTYLSNGLIGNATGFLPNPNAGVVDFLTNGANFNYNALQFDVRRRFTQGLALNANYTFSKNLTNAVGTNQTRFEPLLDNRRPELERARADYDQTHKFNLLANYELPFGKGRAFLNEGFLATLLGDFQIGGILQIGSGAPITITDARGTYNRTGRSARQTAVTSLSKQQLKELVGVYRTANGVFFLPPEVLGRNSDGTFISGFSGQIGQFDDGLSFPGQVFFRNAPGQTSGLERAIFNGPTYYNLDLSLIKRFVVGEKLRFQLQGDLFNVFNTANFTPAQFLDINNVNFGRINAVQNARITQLAFRFEF